MACAGAQEHTAAEPGAAEGRLIYERDCLSCHMADGRGVPGMSPTLLGSPWINGSPEALIGFVLTGGFGPDILMGRFDFIPDVEMAALLTYLREAFAQPAADTGPITPELVARVRAQLP